jgi:hypothetical protein
VYIIYEERLAGVVCLQRTAWLRRRRTLAHRIRDGLLQLTCPLLQMDAGLARHSGKNTDTAEGGGGGRHVLNIYKSDRFTKTGSGQTYGKHSQKKRRFLLLSDTQLTGPPQDHESPGEKTPLFAPFLYKCDHFTKTGSGQT